MHIVRRLFIVRYALYSVILIGGATWTLTSTTIGQTGLKLFAETTRVLAGSAPDALESLAENELVATYVDEAEEAAAVASGGAGLFADRTQSFAFATARALPDTEDLAAALEGWQTDLLEAEQDIRAELGANATDEAIEERLEQLFQPQTIARPLATPAPAPTVPPVTPPPVTPPATEAPPTQAPAAPPPAQSEAAPASPPPTRTSVAFAPHPVFYKCPVIEVSNSGPVADDRTLTQYTPWVETPAGVLIRAPVGGACLSSGYGSRTVEGASKNHAGVDYYNRDGTPIFAAGDGTVAFAGEDAAYGYSVRIDHGNGVEGHYAHMVPGSLKVSTGDQVSLGDEIGVMGSSGRAYAVHLHYELRFAGTTVDPMYEGKRASY